MGYLYPQQVVFSSGSVSSSPLPGRLLVAEGGNLHTYPMIAPNTLPPTFDTGSGATVGTGLIPGKRVRFATFGQEAYGVQEGNAYFNYRIQYNGAVSSMGISPPTFVSVAPGTSTTGLKTGVRTYTATLVDNLGREGSPQTAYASHDYGTVGSTADYVITANVADLQAVKVNFYATVNGGSTLYLLGSQTVTSIGNYTFTDTFTDNQVSAGLAGMYYGKNDPPQPASQIAVWKNHVVLNQTNAPNTIQISNAGSATQFNSQSFQLDSNGNVTNATDGLTMQVGTDQGDAILALVVMGSLLFIFKRRSVWYLAGDDLNDFTVRPVKMAQPNAAVATPIASDSIVYCNIGILYLADDGVYVISTDGTTNSVEKVSQPIENLLYAVRNTTTGRAQMEQAQSWFVNSQYRLAIGPTVYVLNLGSNPHGWALEQY